MDKITEKQTEVGTVMSEASGRPMPQLDPRVVEVYRGVNKVRALSLCTYSICITTVDKKAKNIVVLS
jgi:hypothetical protein